MSDLGFKKVVDPFPKQTAVMQSTTGVPRRFPMVLHQVRSWFMHRELNLLHFFQPGSNQHLIFTAFPDWGKPLPLRPEF